MLTYGGDGSTAGLIDLGHNPSHWFFLCLLVLPIFLRSKLSRDEWHRDGRWSRKHGTPLLSLSAHGPLPNSEAMIVEANEISTAYFLFLC
jgi:hypothetical protein